MLVCCPCSITSSTGHSLRQKTPAVVPVTVLQSREPGELVERQSNSSEVHPTYQGLVHFHNTFDGQLAATEYPKVTVRARSSYSVLYRSHVSPVVVLPGDVHRLRCAGLRVGVALLQAPVRITSSSGEPFRPYHPTPPPDHTSSIISLGSLAS